MEKKFSDFYTDPNSIILVSSLTTKKWMDLEKLNTKMDRNT